MTNDLDEETLKLLAWSKETVLVAEARIGVFGAYDRNFIVKRLIANIEQLTEALSSQCSGNADAPAKSLAIALAVRELEKMPRDRWFRDNADAVIANLLIGLGCEAVVKAWNEAT